MRNGKNSELFQWLAAGQQAVRFPNGSEADVVTDGPLEKTRINLSFSKVTYEKRKCTLTIESHYKFSTNIPNILEMFMHLFPKMFIKSRELISFEKVILLWLVTKK